VEVRPVKSEEFTEAGQVVVAAYAALPGAHLSGGYADELADVAGRVNDSEVFVAVDTRVIGCVTLVPDRFSSLAEELEDGEAGIRMLAVDPGNQRRGVGQALLAACIKRGIQLRRRGLVLHTTPWMTAAQQLYERAGFVRIPQRDFTPIPDVPLVAFRLPLDASRPATDCTSFPS
jgi:ribosomal protein S18 acetylase RimI-like enzyme